MSVRSGHSCGIRIISVAYILSKKVPPPSLSIRLGGSGRHESYSNFTLFEPVRQGEISDKQSKVMGSATNQPDGLFPIGTPHFFFQMKASN